MHILQKPQHSGGSRMFKKGAADWTAGNKRSWLVASTLCLKRGGCRPLRPLNLPLPQRNRTTANTVWHNWKLVIEDSGHNNGSTYTSAPLQVSDTISTYLHTMKQFLILPDPSGSSKSKMATKHRRCSKLSFSMQIRWDIIGCLDILEVQQPRPNGITPHTARSKRK